MDLVDPTPVKVGIYMSFPQYIWEGAHLVQFF